MPVSAARLASFRTLLRIQHDQAYASDLLHSGALNFLSERDHRLTTELVFGVLRHQRLLDWYLGRFSRIPVEKLDLEVCQALRLGAYQILFLMRVPARAAIHESVELVRDSKLRSAVRFTNAVLRRINKDEFEKALSGLSLDSIDDLSIRFSHPEWLIRRWMNAFGREPLIQLLQRNNQPPRTYFRVNTLSMSGAQLVEALRQERVRVQAFPFFKRILEVVEGNIYKTSPFLQGKIFIQDAGSQLVSYLLNPSCESPCLDLCAGSGGKASLIAQLTGGKARIIATDLHWHRLQVGRHLHGEQWQNLLFVVANGNYPLPFARQFDRILVDAPCSGTGTLQRHPEIRWRLKPSNLEELQNLQVALLENASLYLKPEGLLVYSTCSLEEEENDRVISGFLRRHPEFTLDLPPDSNLCQFFNERRHFKLFPPIFHSDGFFAVLLRKSSDCR